MTRSQNETATTESLGSEPLDYPFEVLNIEGSAYRLKARRDADVDGRIRAVVNGIQIGASERVDRIQAGETVYVICDYFPHCSLPAVVDFCDATGAEALAQATTLNSVSAVVNLIGLGVLDEVTLSIGAGKILGRGWNPNNGVAAPFLLLDVNGRTVRRVAVTHVAPDARRGSEVRFEAEMDASDFANAGATFVLRNATDGSSIGTIAYTRSIAGSAESEVVQLKLELKRLEKYYRFIFERIMSEINRRDAKSTARLDAIVEYMLSLIYDKLASAQDEERVSLEPLIQSFNEMVALKSGRVPRKEDLAVVGVDSSFFNEGWLPQELDVRGGPFRWMGVEGFVFNPRPDLLLSHIVVSVACAVPNQVGFVSALADGEPMKVSIMASEIGTPFTLRLSFEDTRFRPIGAVRLVARGAREAGGGDTRVLSIGVSKLTFFFAGIADDQIS